jgi:hypothetical protein
MGIETDPKLLFFTEEEREDIFEDNKLNSYWKFKNNGRTATRNF